MSNVRWLIKPLKATSQIYLKFNINHYAKVAFIRQSLLDIHIEAAIDP
jgi:hypothetical protein